MCGEAGHKSFQCPKNPELDQLDLEKENRTIKPEFHQFHPRSFGSSNQGSGNQGNQGPRRALEDVVCYKCGYKGHYANKCNKGHLAFLSHKAGGVRN